MQNQLIPFVCFQIAAFFGAAGQLFYKKGATSPSSALSVVLIGIGWLLYIGVTMLFIWAYRLGGTVSVLYPTYATTFIWGILLAKRFSAETITSTKLLGTLCIIGGICVVTF